MLATLEPARGHQHAAAPEATGHAGQRHRPIARVLRKLDPAASPRSSRGNDRGAL
ncbi:MAG: hypothetical protein ACT4P0_07040 [Panacagrimonas sp.]